MMIDFLSPEMIRSIYFGGVFALCFVLSYTYIRSGSCELLLRQRTAVHVAAFTLLVIWFVGFRPISYQFGDMWNYYIGYRMPIATYDPSKGHSEWAFELLTHLCRSNGLHATFYFAIISLVYFGSQFLACKKLLWENSWMAMLFILSAFSCFSYSSNGVRNGMACGMVMMAFAYYAVDKSYILPSILCFVAMGVHRSVALPIAAFLAAEFVIKSPKWAIYFWVSSIVISLFAGGAVSGLFAGLGFDDRMQSYLGGTDNSEGTYTDVGYRWDFLLYSFMPVVLTWYAAVYKGIQDRAFNLLSVTYILSNAFWVMIIRAPFSNRFAYLSWFLYPLVLAYGVIRLPIWEDQDRKAGWILLAHAGFTYFMFLIGKTF